MHLNFNKIAEDAMQKGISNESIKQTDIGQKN